MDCLTLTGEGQVIFEAFIYNLMGMKSPTDNLNNIYKFSECKLFILFIKGMVYIVCISTFTVCATNIKN